MIDNRTPARRHLDVQVIIQDDAKSRHALGQHPRRHNDQGQPNQFHWRESVRHSWCMDQLPANKKKKPTSWAKQTQSNIADKYPPQTLT